MVTRNDRPADKLAAANAVVLSKKDDFVLTATTVARAADKKPTP